MAVNLTGSTITFDSGFCAEILSIDSPNFTREKIRTSHMGTTGAHAKMPATLYDVEDMNVRLAFDPSEEPPIDSAAESTVITWSDGTTWTFSGFLTGYKGGGEMETRAEAECTIAINGAVVIA